MPGEKKNAALQSAKLSDIIREDGTLLSSIEISEKFEVSIMTSNSIINSIPRNWKTRLKRHVKT